MKGPTHQRLSKAEFVGFMHIMLAAFPDFAFNVSHYEVNGKSVIAYVHITGTHNGTLALPGLPPFAATGKKVALAQEVQSYIIKKGKIKSFATAASPDAGVAGILAQIGASLPY